MSDETDKSESIKEVLEDKPVDKEEPMDQKIIEEGDAKDTAAKNNKSPKPKVQKVKKGSLPDLYLRRVARMKFVNYIQDSVLVVSGFSKEIKRNDAANSVAKALRVHDARYHIIYVKCYVEGENKNALERDDEEAVLDENLPLIQDNQDAEKPGTEASIGEKMAEEKDLTAIPFDPQAEEKSAAEPSKPETEKDTAKVKAEESLSDRPSDSSLETQLAANVGEKTARKTAKRKSDEMGKGDDITKAMTKAEAGKKSEALSKDEKPAKKSKGESEDEKIDEEKAVRKTAKSARKAERKKNKKEKEVVDSVFVRITGPQFETRWAQNFMSILCYKDVIQPIEDKRGEYRFQVVTSVDTQTTTTIRQAKAGEDYHFWLKFEASMQKKAKRGDKKKHSHFWNKNSAKKKREAQRLLLQDENIPGASTSGTSSTKQQTDTSPTKQLTDTSPTKELSSTSSTAAFKTPMGFELRGFSSITPDYSLILSQLKQAQLGISAETTSQSTNANVPVSISASANASGDAMDQSAQAAVATDSNMSIETSAPVDAIANTTGQSTNANVPVSISASANASGDAMDQSAQAAVATDSNMSIETSTPVDTSATTMGQSSENIVVSGSNTSAPVSVDTEAMSQLTAGMAGLSASTATTDEGITVPAANNEEDAAGDNNEV